MGLSTKNNRTNVIEPLLVFCLCGIFGVLVDIDHAVAFFIGVPKEADHRIWHPTILLVCSLLILCIFAYFAGLYAWTVLRRKHE